MTVYVALLRGINVGGRSMLPMARLRQAAAECGFGAVRTYIQSGNLVFTSPDPPATVSARLAAAVAAAGGPQPRVALRTRDQLAAVVAGNPYAERAVEARQLHVAFLVEDAEPAPLDGLDLDAFAPEALTVAGRETYLFLPGGIGRSKLAIALDRPKSTAATVRNWRTVTTLLELAESTVDGP
jgi:uncharacterized protein (DUF1697 family)